MARKSMFLDIVGRFFGKEAGEDIEEFTEKVNDAGDAGAKSGKKASSSWKDVYELFGNFLPRGLQRSARSFMRTERSVKRTSLSFKGLKKAITATGIGALIVLIGELIANMDNITAAFKNFTTGMLINNAIVAETEKAMRGLFDETYAYEKILKSGNATIAEREAAQKSLARSVEGANELDVQTAEGMETLNGLIEQNIVLTESEAKVKALQAVQENKQEAVEEAWFWSKWYRKHQLVEITSQLTDAQVELNSELAVQNEMVQEIKDKVAVDKVRVSIMETELKFQRQLAEKQIEHNDKLDETQKKRAKYKIQESEIKSLIDETTKAKNIAVEGSIEQIEEEKKLQALLQEKKLLLMDIALFEKEAAQAIRDKAQADKDLDSERIKSLENLVAKVKRAEDKLTEDKFETQRTLLKAQEKADLAALVQLKASEEQMQAVRDSYRLIQEDNNMKQAEAVNAAEWKRIDTNAQIAYELLAEGQSAFENEMDQLKFQYQERMIAVEGDEALEMQIRKKFAEQKAELIERTDREASQARLAGAFELGNALADIMNSASALGEENAERQKKIAIFNVLLNQAQALAAAIAGATQAAAATGPAAPFTMGVYIASMVGAVIGGFAQIKSIMSQANVPTSGIETSSPSRMTTGTLAPTFGGQTNSSTQVEAVQAYVVESQLSYMQEQALRLRNKTSL